jgi:Phosphotransferase enzyme family
MLRCRRPGGANVIVKSYPRTAAGERGFSAEASGLAFCSDTGMTPGFLGANATVPLVVMTDLGGAPDLAGLLLGDQPEPARAALIRWATACGRLSALMAGRAHELVRLRARYPGAPGVLATPWLAREVRDAPRVLALAGVAAPDGLDADLAEVAAIAEPGNLDVFSPGDLCPDNVLVTGDGPRFFDFEESGYQSVFLNAAYMRMPFSTCWCVLRLPPDLAARGEAAYRAEVSAIMPELADDGAWQHGIARAMGAWTLDCMSAVMGRSMERDGTMNGEVAGAPTARQLLRYQWRTLAGELGATGDLPALAAVMESLLGAASGWEVPDLPGYPAFRRRC